MVHVVILSLVTQLLDRVGEETDLALAKPTRIAEARAVLGWVEPVLEHTVGKMTSLSPAALPVAVVWACHSRVVVPARVAATGLLAAVGEGALGPVVAAHPGAALDLESVHPEVTGTHPTRRSPRRTGPGSGSGQSAPTPAPRTRSTPDWSSSAFCLSFSNLGKCDPISEMRERAV
ncbi:uncharacterized protein LOC130775258 [Actinidia eriantha]|uniref:uncharacterized protein LOC130775258 n=1 Tax=Actinidia eriantha TaxID=165200 RepID=UPI002590E5AF|nr:uncharacterized protein LOC130775258 [Actinidia eriantha]